MWKSLKVVSGCACLLVLSACAAPPVAPPEGTELNTSAPRDIDGSSTAVSTGTVWWGGVVLDAQNLETGTHLEILAYPLDRIGRPVLNRDSVGRFIAIADTYLEPVDYAQGRSLTIVGELDGQTDVNIGASSQSVPTVRIRDHHLWRPDGLEGRPRVSFGIGINISN